MKRIIIVAPHFPPSNLAGVHRSRLFAQHLPEFGWYPTIVTVRPQRYEEALDPDLTLLLPSWLEVIEVGAFPTKPLRLVGDVGIRGFVPLLVRILRLVNERGADFILIPVPSFYAALLGRLVHFIKRVPYGIDFIDPWVQPATGRENLKGRLSLAIARFLEPIAVRRASLISGVAERYYEDVLRRNPHLRKQAVIAAMPYGAESDDHEKVRQLHLRPYLFEREEGKFRVVFAGALMPRAFEPLDQFCKAVAADPELFNDVEFFFIGTGRSPNDPHGHTVRPFAERHGLWGTRIREHPQRIPYLDTLVHLEAADAILVLGSTEAHYTPSKVFQAILAKKPIFAILHSASSGAVVLEETRAGLVLRFDGVGDVGRIEKCLAREFRRFRMFANNFNPEKVDAKAFTAYSAKNTTSRLASAIDQALSAARERSHG